MASVIKIKRSGTTTAPSSLASGELAYSWEASTGGKLYIGWGDETTPGEADNIAAVGGKYFTDKLDHTPGVLTANSALIVDIDSKLQQILVDNISIDGNSITSTNLNGNITISPNGTGSVDVDTSKIINLSTPTAGTDAANKQYVDDEISALNAASNLDISGDSGTDSVFLISEVLNFAGGTGLTSTVANNSVTFVLDDTAVTPGSYGSATEIPTFTVDQQGRITAASTTSIATTLSITGDSGSDGVSLLNETLNFAGGTGITTAVSNNVVTITGDDATTTTKGIASFDATDFTVTSGAVSVNAITLGTSSLNPGETTTAIAGLTQLDVDNIRIDGNTISSTNTDGNIVINPNGAGLIDASSTRIINVTDPTGAQDAATKQYVDTIAAASLHYHDPVRVETPGDIGGVYDNGTSGVGATITNNGVQAALVIDGITLNTNDRVLVYNQSIAAHNGIYVVTNTGSISTNWVLTRASDADTYGPSDPDSLGRGDAFFVKEGVTGAGELYVMTTEGDITFGTTPITFSQIAASQIYSAGDGLSLNGVTFSVNVDDSSIEINADTLRVKAGGITNDMLAGDIASSKLANAFINFAADTGTADPVFLEQTVTIAGSNGIETSVSANNEVTVSGVNATTSSVGVASFSSTNFAVSSGEVTVIAVDGGTY